MQRKIKKNEKANNTLAKSNGNDKKVPAPVKTEKNIQLSST
jgi:hypothetical protein